MSAEEIYKAGQLRRLEEIIDNQASRMQQLRDENETLLWLLKMFRSSNLHMDGTSNWVLPLNVLSGIRTRTAIDAITEAKRRYDEWTTSNTTSKNSGPLRTTKD